MNMKSQFRNKGLNWVPQVSPGLRDLGGSEIPDARKPKMTSKEGSRNLTPYSCHSQVSQNQRDLGHPAAAMGGVALLDHRESENW